jgi:hypothetical protein
MRTGERAALVVGIALVLLGPGAPARAEEPGASGPATGGSPAQPPPTEIATVHRVRRVPLGLGLGALGVSYGLKALVDSPLIAIGADGRCDACRRDALELLVPIAGPLLVAHGDHPQGDSAFRAFFTVWSVAEAAAVTLTIIGLVGHDVPVGPAERPAPSVTVVPVVTRGLGALSLNVTW